MKSAAWLLGIALAAFVLVTRPVHPGQVATDGQGVAAVQIERPATQSRVTAPLEIRARLVGQGGAKLWLELFGKDGRLLARRVLRLALPASSSAVVNEPLDFEIPGASEEGWLRLVVQDRQLRWMAVDSVPLTLLREGRLITAPAALMELDIRIQQPAAQARISGGVLEVQGMAGAEVKLPLRVQLVDAEGRVVGQRLAGGEPAGTDGQAAFSAQVSYHVTAPTEVRLLVFEAGSDLLQVEHLSSLELILNP